MMRRCRETEIVPGLLLAVLLVAAQSVAVVHDFEHDAGAPQKQACATCVAAGQLASACVDSAVATDVFEFGSIVNGASTPLSHGIDALDVRQRGPPRSL